MLFTTLFSGGAPIIKKFQIGEAMANAGVPVVVGGAGNAGSGPGFHKLFRGEAGGDQCPGSALDQRRARRSGHRKGRRRPGGGFRRRLRAVDSQTTSVFGTSPGRGQQAVHNRPILLIELDLEVTYRPPLIYLLAKSVSFSGMDNPLPDVNRNRLFPGESKEVQCGLVDINDSAL